MALCSRHSRSAEPTGKKQIATKNSDNTSTDKRPDATTATRLCGVSATALIRLLRVVFVGHEEILHAAGMLLTVF